MISEIIEKKEIITLCENPIPIDYSEIPEITGDDYIKRITRLWSMPKAQEYSAIVVYGDREHFSNVHYFTGYDPRFEETLLVLKPDEIPKILVGNEGMGYISCIPMPIEPILYQSFSLVGQPNSSSRKLGDILKDLLHSNEKIGLIGWKTYNKEYFDFNCLITDVPDYIVECLAQTVARENIYNAADLLLDNEYGLKHNVEAKEIIGFEVKGTKASRGTYNAIKALKPGVSEIEASAELMLDGDCLCTHPNLNFGDKHVAMGLSSPDYYEKLKYGKVIAIGYGLRGSLVHRAGIYSLNEASLPEDKKDYIEKVVKPYFNCVAEWYEMMKIGTFCGKIYKMVSDELGFEKFNIGLNPGHSIHTDEWTNSPFTQNNSTRIHSGMVLQCDFTVFNKEPYMPCHIEDGLAIADQKLQQEIKELSPQCYERILARRKFMKEVLYINLPDEVLPLSDLPAVCFPYMADTSVILVRR